MVDIVHKSVLQKEVLELLAPTAEEALIIDATLGEGGHSEAFLESFPRVRVVGLDADEEILAVARGRLLRFGNRFQAYHRWFNLFFSEYPGELPRPHRILFDLGISLFHYQRSGRGFSFQSEDLLDMRLNDGLETSAYHIINEYPEEELANLIYQYGEERYSRRIARGIVLARGEGAIRRSKDLAGIVHRSVPAEYRHGRIDAATRTFQALRIAVNGELVRLEQGLNEALSVLPVGGRIGVISFHSLEDRIVKQFFRMKNRECTCPPEWPVCKCGGVRIVDILTKHPVRATEDEVASNAPSRSAKFRVIEKVNEEGLQ